MIRSGNQVTDIKLRTKLKLLHLVSIGFGLSAWQLIVSGGVISKNSLPAPTYVLQALLELVSRGLPPGHLLWGHIGHSAFRVIGGFAIAGLLGIGLGILIGISPTVKAVTTPWVELLRPIPPLAWIPVAIMWFGIGNPSAIFVIAYGAFFPILLNTVSGMKEVDQRYLEAALTLGAARKDLIQRVMLPGAAPVIFIGLRVGWQISWMTLVAAEFTGIRSGYGLGYLITIASDLQRPAFVMAGMAVIGVLGYLTNFIFEVLQKRILQWK